MSAHTPPLCTLSKSRPPQPKLQALSHVMTEPELPCCMPGPATRPRVIPKQSHSGVRYMCTTDWLGSLVVARVEPCSSVFGVTVASKPWVRGITYRRKDCAADKLGSNDLRRVKAGHKITVTAVVRPFTTWMTISRSTLINLAVGRCPWPQ